MTQILWIAANLAAMAVLAWITLRHKQKGELDYTIKAIPPETDSQEWDIEPQTALIIDELTSRWLMLECRRCTYKHFLDTHTGLLFDELTQPAPGTKKESNDE